MRLAFVAIMFGYCLFWDLTIYQYHSMQIITGEIDICEIGWSKAYANNVPNQFVLAAAHFSQPSGRNLPLRHTITPHQLNTTFHTYRLEWTPQSLSMTVDDYTVLTVPDIASCAADGSCAELHQPHYLILNLAVGGGFTYIPGTGDPADRSRITAPFPAVMKVDYVRIYDNGFTQLSGSYFGGGGGGGNGAAATTSPDIAALLRNRTESAEHSSSNTATPTTFAPSTAMPITSSSEPTVVEPSARPTSVFQTAPTLRPTIPLSSSSSFANSTAATLAPTNGSDDATKLETLEDYNIQNETIFSSSVTRTPTSAASISQRRWMLLLRSSIVATAAIVVMSATI